MRHYRLWDQSTEDYIVNKPAPRQDRPAQVLAALQGSERPLSAYALLDLLREDGFRAPLQVYRALEKLQQDGSVHRVESLNAFIACHREGCHHAQNAVFAICDECGAVDEFADAKLAQHVKACAEAGGFRMDRSSIEITGHCENCAAAQH